MPATRFICPDGGTIKIAECLNEGCRMADDLEPIRRCLSLRTLRLIADQRPWRGQPSVTQLIKGTREAYLEIVSEYAIDPQDHLFRVRGTQNHDALAVYVEGDEISETRFGLEADVSGQPDFFDEEGVLWDNKFWGSWKIAKSLGLNGDAHRGRLDVAIQLNAYRILAERETGRKARCMAIEAIARDGNTWVAQKRGLTLNGYPIIINTISDHWVERYLKAKRRALLHALKHDSLPSRCRPRETWQGRKCKAYCDVREVCARIEGREIA